MSTSCVSVGCSGWQYRHWRGDFYPAELPVRQGYEFYAQHFDTVEINNTFYRLPGPEVFRSWRERAPAGFTFAVKASRFLTHMKKLKDPEEPLALFFSRARELGRTLGPVLYQLPPRWPVDIARLETFLEALPKRRQHVLEFRAPTGYRDDVFALLERFGVALCLHDMQGSATGPQDVGPFVYVRFHGTERYSGSYSDERLERWAEWLGARVRAGKHVYAYFNNDVGGHAPRDAVRLRTMLGELGTWNGSRL
jgi:uncharacterized protein YecE (DUF72 family)